MGDRDYFRHDFGDSGGLRPSFFATIPATKILIITLVTIHVVVTVIRGMSPAAGRTIDDVFALQRESALGRFWLWQFVTSGLLHARGVSHLLWNCVGIYFFGSMVEERLGQRRFWFFCLAAQIVSVAVYLTESVIIDNMAQLVGASGYEFGLIVLAALWYPHREVLLFFVLRIKLWLLAVVIVLADFLLMFEQTADRVAHSAHLGGALYAWIYFKTGGAERLVHAADNFAEKRQRKREHKDAEKASELRAEVDRILDKVNREGMTALTEEEKRFLKRASGRLGK